MFTMKDLLVRYELNHATVELENPRQFILSRRMPWSIVLKAFEIKGSKEMGLKFFGFVLASFL